MTTIAKIRAEIERLIRMNQTKNGFPAGSICAIRIEAYERLLAWLEKQEEQKLVEIHIDNPNVQKFDPDVKITTSDSSADGKELLYVSNKSYNIGLRDGMAEQKRKMMGGAVEGDVIELGETYKDLSLSVNAKELNQVLQPLGVGDGDKVKIIIVKEDGQ